MLGLYFNSELDGESLIPLHSTFRAFAVALISSLHTSYSSLLRSSWCLTSQSNFIEQSRLSPFQLVKNVNPLTPQEVSLVIA